jgi:integrase
VSSSIYTGRKKRGSQAEALDRMLRNAVVSNHSKRAYSKALTEFLELHKRIGGPFSRALMMEYRAGMVDAGLSASTINMRVSAMRRFVREACDNGLLDPLAAARISSVKGVPCGGVRLGRWLTVPQVRKLLAVPDRTTLKGKRDFLILSILVHCALRRFELARLDLSRIQKREGRWVIADLIGKRGRVRTVAVPAKVKTAIDEWTSAAKIRSGRLLRRISKGDRPLGGLSAWGIWYVVVNATSAIGIKNAGPHDLRRTSARLCRKSGGDLDEIKEFLGHASIVTTDKYLGNGQAIVTAINDDLGI